MARLLPGDLGAEFEDTSTGISMRRLKFNDGWIGAPVVALESATNCRVAYVVRFGEALLPTTDTLIQDGDDIHAMVPSGSSSDVERALSKPPKAAS